MKLWMWVGMLMGFVCSLGAGEQLYSPRESFLLEVDGVRHAVELDKPIEPKLLATGKPVILRAAEHRVFDHGGVYFHIPRETNVVSRLQAGGSVNWDFSRSKFKFSVVLIPLFDGELSELRDTTVTGMQEAFNNVEARKLPAELQFKSGLVKGEKIIFPIGDDGVSFEMYFMKCGKGALMLLMPTSNELILEEAKTARAMFLETFKVK